MFIPLFFLLTTPTLPPAYDLADRVRMAYPDQLEFQAEVNSHEGQWRKQVRAWQCHVSQYEDGTFDLWADSGQSQYHLGATLEAGQYLIRESDGPRQSRLTLTGADYHADQWGWELKFIDPVGICNLSPFIGSWSHPTLNRIEALAEIIAEGSTLEVVLKNNHLCYQVETDRYGELRDIFWVDAETYRLVAWENQWYAGGQKGDRRAQHYFYCPPRQHFASR